VINRWFVGFISILTAHLCFWLLLCYSEAELESILGGLLILSNAILLLSIPLGLVASNELIKCYKHWPSTQWWLTTGAWQAALSIHSLVGLGYIYFGVGRV
jgi:uncharacterized membrane protein YfcA